MQQLLIIIVSILRHLFFNKKQLVMKFIPTVMSPIGNI